MKLNIYIKRFAIGCLLLIPSIDAISQVKAFPTAEGYGKHASGGRGGVVVEVTTLEDYNPTTDKAIVGSFRWAFTQAKDSTKNKWGTYIYSWKPMTVVFKVGGVISLKSELKVTRDNMTIAGQTAPGDGICFRGATLNFSGSKNLIVRHLRSRPGDELGLETSGFRIENGARFIVDHCSMSWAIEETTHFSNNDSTTVQWCIVSESLYNSLHKKGARGYGTQWGGEFASYHHNLLAHHNSRMPRINGSNSNDVKSLVDYRNNVNFNWGSAGAFYGGEWEAACTGYCHTNVVNNYFKPGPATSGTTFVSPSLNRDNVTLCGYAGWYLSGNIMVGNDSKTADNWTGVDGSAVGGISNVKSDNEFVYLNGVVEDYDSYTQTAEAAYASVLAGAGAIYPKRDVHDTRVVAETKGDLDIVRYAYTIVHSDDGTTQATPIKGTSSGLIDTQVNLVPTAEQATATAWSVYSSSVSSDTDTDKDGIPDSWELANGLDKTSAADGNKLTVSGYTALEVYLNELAGEKIALEFPNGNAVENHFTENVVDVVVTGDNLQILTDVLVSNVCIYNQTGATVLKKSENNISEISISSLPIGVYLAKIESEVGIKTLKFVKTR